MAINLGINLNWCADWDAEHLPADLMWSARAWAIVDGNGSNTYNQVGVADNTSLDTEGWPIVQEGTAFGTIFEMGSWPGVYKLSFTNRTGTSGDTVTSEFGNVVLSNRQHNAGSNITTYDVTVTYVSGSFIWLMWEGSTGGIYDVHLMRPLKDASGWHEIGTPLSDYIIDRLQWFTTIRTMQTGGGASGLTAGTDTVWSGRTRPYGAQSISGDFGRGGGLAIENRIAIANQAQKDLWICLPFRCDDDYILQTARAVRYGTDGVTPYTSDQGSPVFPPLDAGLNVYVEHGNEIWNSGNGYPANENKSINDADILAGDPNKTNYDASDNAWYHSWRRTGWLAVRHSLIFRDVFGGAAMMSRVRPILATQHSRYATTEEPLNYIANVWGAGSSYNTINGVTNPKQPVSYYLYALATAPYIPGGNDGLDVTSAATLLDGAVADLSSTTAGDNVPAMTWNHDIADTHGIAYIAYEGGSNFIPELMPGGATQSTIQKAKDACFDSFLGARMGANLGGDGLPLADQSNYVYGRMFQEWDNAGGGLFCLYTLGQSSGPGGTFGICPPSTQSGSDTRLESGPKWTAIKAFLAATSTSQSLAVSAYITGAVPKSLISYSIIGDSGARALTAEAVVSYKPALPLSAAAVIADTAATVGATADGYVTIASAEGPAITVREQDVLLQPGAVQVDLPVLPNRYWVRIVNPHPTKRVLISKISSEIDASCDAVAPDFGVWEDPVGDDITLWARTEDGSAVTIRVKQYAR